MRCFGARIESLVKSPCEVAGYACRFATVPRLFMVWCLLWGSVILSSLWNHTSVDMVVANSVSTMAYLALKC